MANNFKQHIVPRFYIAFFSADGQGVYVKTNGNASIYQNSPTGEGFEKDAFTIMNNGERDTSCDDANKVIENWCGRRLTRLVVTSHPTDEQWQAIWLLTANLISRSRWTRDHNAWAGEGLQEVLPKVVDVLKKLPPLPEAVSSFG